MPKRNYQFEKRQKDLAKKRKQEEKIQRRLERRAAATQAEEPPVDGVSEDGKNEQL